MSSGVLSVHMFYKRFPSRFFAFVRLSKNNAVGGNSYSKSSLTRIFDSVRISVCVLCPVTDCCLIPGVFTPHTQRSRDPQETLTQLTESHLIYFGFEKQVILIETDIYFSDNSFLVFCEWKVEGFQDMFVMMLLSRVHKTGRAVHKDRHWKGSLQGKSLCTPI